MLRAVRTIGKRRFDDVYATRYVVGYVDVPGGVQCDGRWLLESMADLLNVRA